MKNARFLESLQTWFFVWPLLLSGLAGCDAGQEKAGTSVILITLDTMRTDALGSYGSGGTGTPHLDRLAAGGVLFESAISQAPATGPSFASMMTSLYPTEHGAIHSTKVIDEGNVMLAERFRDFGHRTGAFVSCSILNKRYGFDQGFSVYDDETGQRYSGNHSERSAAETTSRALRWLEQRPEEMFFLWIHYFDAHAPYREHPQPGAESGRERMRRGTNAYLRALERSGSQAALLQNLPGIRALYDAEVRYIDQQVGRLLAGVEALGWRDHSLVVVSADHGEELFDHGFFHGHYRSLSESVLRVPLIFWFPKSLPRGLRIDSVVQNIDIAPTILSIAGLPPLEKQSGVDLEPTMLGARSDDGRLAWSMREPYASMPGGNAIAVRDQRFKAIFYSKAAPRLYDLETDGMEREDLSMKSPERLRAFRSLADEWLGKGEAASILEADLDDRDYELLKGLGYIE